MNMKFQLQESYQDIKLKILKAAQPEIRQIMNRGIRKVTSELPILIKDIVMTSPEYYDIIGGKLKLELGIPNGVEAIDGLISIWTQNIDYNYIPPKISAGKLKTSFSASAFRIDFSDVLYSPYAKVYDKLRGYELPWLEWLVLMGNIPIVQNYEVQFGYNERSRTGKAVMVRGDSWSVPLEYSGTINDNWITRAIKASEQRIQNMIQGAFQ
jgi:hypothetical protein